MVTFLKIILIGDATVGKTSIQRNYFGMNFEKNYIQTLGADFAIKKIGENTIQIWDLAGQKNYNVFRKQYFRGSKGAIIVFDITNKESLERLSYWYKEIKFNLGFNIPVAFVGNKIDLRSDKEKFLTETEVKPFISAFLEDGKVNYMETSALTGENIEKLFEDIIERMLEFVSQ